MPDDPSIDSRTWKVFISYSWDDDEHTKWVRSFADRLRNDGIDAILDQTHLGFGGRTPQFMERSVRDSHEVLVICTEGYKQRFDGRKGGAGYEGHIITAEILSSAGANKFIPVLRQGDWSAAVPTALDGVFGVDLRTDSVGATEIWCVIFTARQRFLRWDAARSGFKERKETYLLLFLYP